MATENPTWGYTRIRGGLKSLGHDVTRNTIKAILRAHGIEPGAFRICSDCGAIRAMRGHVIAEDLFEGAVIDGAANP
jgi:hypothetical protein